MVHSRKERENRILNLLFPPKCVFCGCVMERRRDGICPACLDKLPVTQGAQRQQNGDFFDKCVSPLYYDTVTSGSVLRYKFGGRQSFCRCYGKLLAACIKTEWTKPIDLVTWAPVSRRRKRQRGYDQAFLLAQVVAAELALPLVSTLEKFRHVPKQSTIKDPARRRANVQGAYRMRPAAIASVRDKTVLVVDDIITSGATLSECAKQLLLHGAERVVCGTVFRSHPLKW